VLLTLFSCSESPDPQRADIAPRDIYEELFAIRQELTFLQRDVAQSAGSNPTDLSISGLRSSLEYINMGVTMLDILKSANHSEFSEACRHLLTISSLDRRVTNEIIGIGVPEATSARMRQLVEIHNKLELLLIPYVEEVKAEDHEERSKRELDSSVAEHVNYARAYHVGFARAPFPVAPLKMSTDFIPSVLLDLFSDLDRWVDPTSGLEVISGKLAREITLERISKAFAPPGSIAVDVMVDEVRCRRSEVVLEVSGYTFDVVKLFNLHEDTFTMVTAKKARSQQADGSPSMMIDQVRFRFESYAYEPVLSLYLK